MILGGDKRPPQGVPMADYQEHYRDQTILVGRGASAIGARDAPPFGGKETVSVPGPPR